MRWAKREPYPDLTGADLSGANLFEVDFFCVCLAEVNLSGASFSDANLFRANLSRANLSGASFSGSNLAWADLSGANLVEANLHRSNLTRANLVEADLSGAYLFEVDLSGANLTGSNLSGVLCGGAFFADVDFSSVRGLDKFVSYGPNSLGLDTIIRSRGKIPEAFLRGCGIPDVWTAYIPDLLKAMDPIQFYSCFISYSTKDEEFAQWLRGRMTQKGLRVWYSPKDARGGRKMHDQIDEAIRVHDKLLLILSEESMRSDWVMTEIRKARKAERRDGKQKLFPIRITSYENLRDWECPDGTTGEDLAAEVRAYFIPDFEHWKNNTVFEERFAGLLRDLKAEGPPSKGAG